MKKIATNYLSEPYECRQEWPPNCPCQCGDSSVLKKPTSISLTEINGVLEIVKTSEEREFTKKTSRPAFFEAFPENLGSPWIRGIGKSIEEAEQNAYAKYLKILNCSSHSFERNGRTDGYAICSLCNVKGKFLDPLTCCEKCQVPTAYGSVKKTWFCELHYYELDEQEIFDNFHNLSSLEKEELECFRRSKQEHLILLEHGYVSGTPLYAKIKEIFFQYMIMIEYKLRDSFSLPEIEEMVKDPGTLRQALRNLLIQKPDLMP